MRYFCMGGQVLKLYNSSSALCGLFDVLVVGIIQTLDWLYMPINPICLNLRIVLATAGAM